MHYYLVPACQYEGRPESSNSSSRKRAVRKQNFLHVTCIWFDFSCIILRCARKIYRSRKASRKLPRIVPTRMHNNNIVVIGLFVDSRISTGKPYSLETTDVPRHHHIAHSTTNIIPKAICVNCRHLSVLKTDFALVVQKLKCIYTYTHYLNSRLVSLHLMDTQRSRAEE